MTDLKIAMIQSNLCEDVDKNLQHLANLLQNVENDTHLIILPELFATGFSVDYAQCAESIEGKSMQWLKKEAQKKQCVITGSLLIIEDNKIYNRLIWMKADGSFSSYDKRHVFRMSSEKDAVSEGSQDLLVNLHGWKIKPLVCYDLRFPLWSRNRYQNDQYQYDILLYVASWPQVRNHVWKSLLPARAIENITYTIGVNRVGTDSLSIYSGDSATYNPKGEIIAGAKPHEEQVIHCVLSYNALQTFRQKFNVGLDWDHYSLEN